MATVHVDEELSRLINDGVARYGFADAASYVRELISRNEAYVDWLRRELQDGLDSGISSLSIDEVFDQALEKARRYCA